MSEFSIEKFIGAIVSPEEAAEFEALACAEVAPGPYGINHDGKNVIELTSEADIIKSGMSAADVAAAIERIVRPPNDATAIREGLRMHIDILPPIDPS